jgi:hypothetical protein
VGWERYFIISPDFLTIAPRPLLHPYLIPTIFFCCVWDVILPISQWRAYLLAGVQFVLSAVGVRPMSAVCTLNLCVTNTTPTSPLMYAQAITLPSRLLQFCITNSCTLKVVFFFSPKPLCHQHQPHVASAVMIPCSSILARHTQAITLPSRLFQFCITIS